MNVFYEILSNLKTILQSSELLESVKIVDSLNSSSMPSILKKVYAAIGISNVQVTKGSFSNYIGETVDEELFGKLADVDISIKIYSPFNIGSQSCYDAFSDICEVLLKSDNVDLNIQSISSGNLKYDINTSNFTLDCIIKISTFIGFGKEKLTDNNEILAEID